METMPLHLKQKLALQLHQGALHNFQYLWSGEQSQSTFIIWIGHRLIKRLYFEKTPIYNEGDILTGIFFIQSGQVNFCIKLSTLEDSIFKSGRGHVIGFEDFLIPLLNGDMAGENVS